MTKDHAYLYLGSVSEAKRQNELALWRASHLENIACKQAIEEAIRRGFDGAHLSHDCARSVIEDFTRWKSSTWREKRKHIQAVFQDASGTLNPARSVYHNVEEALRNLTHLDRRQRQMRIDELMELTHMDSHLLQIPVRQLSGGEQRRLSLLRALSIYPQFLVLDEVTSGLDLLSTDAVLQVLERYHEEFGCAYLLITHDRQTAYRISSRVLELNRGVFVREAIRTESI